MIYNEVDVSSFPFRLSDEDRFSKSGHKGMFIQPGSPSIDWYTWAQMSAVGKIAELRLAIHEGNANLEL